MVSLVAMWVHVWQHEVAHDDEEDDHFGPEVSEQCLLADSPPVALVAGPACFTPLVRSLRQATPANAFADNRWSIAFRIRAPPAAV